MAKQDRQSPPSPSLLKKNQAPTEIGDTAGISLNGIIVNDDYNNKLTGRQGVQVYNQMRYGDATVNASLMAIMLPILSARWWVEEAPEGTRQDTKVAEFVEGEIMRNGSRTWQEMLNEILDYLVYGRMPFEIVWEFRDEDNVFGRPMIGLRKLARRAPDTILAWRLPNGDPGLLQQTVNGKFEIPMEKAIVFVNQKKGDNWEGNSLLRTAYKHWYIKDKLYLIDAISAERQGLGVPKGKVPSGAKESDKSKMEEILQNLRANERGYALIEGDMDIEFMDMKSGTTKPLLPVIQHHDRAIVLNVLAQFLQLGSTSVGSFALSNDQSKLFLLCIEAIANYIADTINRYLVVKLVDYNFNNIKSYPKLRFEKIGNVDHNILTTSLQRAIQTGVLTPQPEDEDYLRDVMDLPERSEYQPVDPTMFDSLFSDLDSAVAGLNSAEGLETEEPATAVAPEDMTDEELTEAAEAIGFTFKGGAAGQPLSEETKRKISEALKKHGSKGGKGGKGKGKKKDPEMEKMKAESTKLRKEARALQNEYRQKMLEMKAKGVKLSEQESAKLQLELFEKKNKLTERIESLKEQMDARKSSLASKAEPKTPAKEKKAHDVGDTLDRINSILDGYEK